MESARSVDSRNVEVAMEVAQAINALPAVATLSWAERAAASLLPLRPDALIAVSIGEVDEDGNLVRVEATGSAVEIGADRLDNFKRRFDGGGGLGWRAERLGVGANVKQRNVDASPGSEAWRRMGVTQLLTGTVPLVDRTPSRVLVVELGLRAEDRPFTDGEMVLLRATLTPVARKAVMAFGSNADSPSHPLTAREQEVLEHLTLGKSVKQIAMDLQRSPHTVHDHVKSLHRKLHASSRGELIARALGHLGVRRPAGGAKRQGLMSA